MKKYFDVEENKKYISEIGTKEWIDVLIYSFKDNKNNIESETTLFTCLVKSDYITETLKDSTWDINPWMDHTKHFEDWETGEIIYSKGHEYFDDLFYPRDFSGKDSFYYELSEDFRLFYNLYELDKGNELKEFYYIDVDNGKEDLIAYIDNNKRDIKIKLKYLKEYASVKKMNIISFFEITKTSNNKLEESDFIQENDITEECNIKYYSSNDFDGNKSFFRTHGKKIIKSIDQSEFRILKKENKYADFIIGIDNDGNEILHSCNTKQENHPGYLSLAFFSRDVLKKYYDTPSKYEVDDGSVSYKGFWDLRIMNNDTDYVCVFLGDLKNIPYDEQLYWKSFNVTPKKIAFSDFERNFNAEFTDAEHPELFFKQKYSEFNEAWLSKFGWPLFKPLEKEDDDHLKSLHIPLVNDQKEFKEQVLSLSKILIDSLNDKGLAKFITLDENDKSIRKLEKFLIVHDLHLDKMIEFISMLQTLRSKWSAHTFNDDSQFKKCSVYFNLESKDYKTIMQEIIIKSVWIFNTLENNFLK